MKKKTIINYWEAKMCLILLCTYSYFISNLFVAIDGIYICLIWSQVTLGFTSLKRKQNLFKLVLMFYYQYIVFYSSEILLLLEPISRYSKNIVAIYFFSRLVLQRTACIIKHWFYLSKVQLANSYYFVSNGNGTLVEILSNFCTLL